MEVIRLVEAKILSVSEQIFEVLDYGSSFPEFEALLKKELDQLGFDLLEIAKI